MEESAKELPRGPQAAQPQRSEAKASTGSFRWLVIFLLFYITVANYIDRSAIAFATSDIKSELGLGPAEIGLILGSLWAWLRGHHISWRDRG